MNKYLLIIVIAISIFIAGCKKGEGINIFSIQDDIELGMQTKAQIAANPAEFPILNEHTHAAAYAYVRGIVSEILEEGNVTYKNQFPWEVYIIDQDVQNAFCAPGGFIYVYTGLIKYLDDKSSLAGVLGHEMAHADKRHSTELLTKRYGVQTLLDVLLGKNQNLLTQIASELVHLRFSRNEEREADEYSVIYLCPTKYNAAGAASFFQKIIDQGSSNPPEFLSSHPNPDNRVENIQGKANELSCVTSISQQEEITGYQQFKSSLP